jgi:hypothetical protein
MKWAKIQSYWFLIQAGHYNPDTHRRRTMWRQREKIVSYGTRKPALHTPDLGLYLKNPEISFWYFLIYWLIDWLWYWGWNPISVVWAAESLVLHHGISSKLMYLFNVQLDDLVFLSYIAITTVYLNIFSTPERTPYFSAFIPHPPSPHSPPSLHPQLWATTSLHFSGFIHVIAYIRTSFLYNAR